MAARRFPDEGEEQRHNPNTQIHLQFPAGHFLRPGRKQRHNQIQAHQHVHEPQVPGGIVEVEQQALEILYGLSPDQSIYHRPHQQRNQDAHRPAAEELPGGIMDGKLQVAGRYHEQRHAATGNALHYRHPEGVRVREDQGSVSAQIEGLGAVHHHHQEAGRNPQEVQPDFSLCAHSM